MNFNQGDIVWVDFPFTDGNYSKPRPVLIISNHKVNSRVPILIVFLILFPLALISQSNNKVNSLSFGIGEVFPSKLMTFNVNYNREIYHNGKLSIGLKSSLMKSQLSVITSETKFKLNVTETRDHEFIILGIGPEISYRLNENPKGKFYLNLSSPISYGLISTMTLTAVLSDHVTNSHSLPVILDRNKVIGLIDTDGHLLWTPIISMEYLFKIWNQDFSLSSSLMLIGLQRFNPNISVSYKW